MRKQRSKADMDAPKVLSEEEIKIKLENYCAYRERCVQEVRQKMYQLQIPAEEQDGYIRYLQENSFLNEDRFVHGFARGKFNIKHWGKNKIRAELRAKNIQDKQIHQSLQQIDEGDYFMALLQLLEKKLAVLKEPDVYKKQQKLFNFALQKGYESEWIREALKALKI